MERFSRVTRVKPVYMRLPGFCQSVLEACHACQRREGRFASPPERRPLCPANRLFLIFKVFFQTVLRPDRPLLSVLSESRQRYFKRQPVESVPGARGKPVINCRPHFVAAVGEKGALRLPPPPESCHPVLQHSTRRAVPMDDGGCGRKHLGPIKGTARKHLSGVGAFHWESLQRGKLFFGSCL